MPETDPEPAGGPPAPVAALQDLILGKWLTQAVSVAAKLGIADMLEDGPRACDELARANQVNEGALYRVLRAGQRGRLHRGGPPPVRPDAGGGAVAVRCPGIAAGGGDRWPARIGPGGPGASSTRA